jgi:uncharacterized protein YgfB (UPF0149 family)
MSQPLPDYDQVNDALQGVPCEFDAAEFHGQLCGLLSTCDRLQLHDWLMVSLPESDPASLSPPTHELFQALLDHDQAALGSEDFGFQLLLPGDTAGLAARLEALANWCQGFLFGISHAGVTDIQALPGELPEIVEDFLNISRAEDFELENEEEDEVAYMELVEYVRVGVQLFREELRSQPENTTASPDSQLH